MTPYDVSVRQAERQHATWSAAIRRDWEKDGAALDEAVRSGEINDLTDADRNALLARYTKARDQVPTHRRHHPRQPLTFEPATRRAAPVQSFFEGELFHAVGKSFAGSVLVNLVGAVLKVYLMRF